MNDPSSIFRVKIEAAWSYKAFIPY